jgi:hypothetical protein
MKFIMLIKHTEDRKTLPKELLDAIAKLTEHSEMAPVIVASGGLAPTAATSRVRISGGDYDRRAICGDQRGPGRLRHSGIQVAGRDDGKRAAIYGAVPQTVARFGETKRKCGRFAGRKTPGSKQGDWI